MPAANISNVPNPNPSALLVEKPIEQSDSNLYVLSFLYSGKTKIFFLKYFGNFFNIRLFFFRVAKNLYFLILLFSI